jgi:1-acylglycerone phosphate reductase
MITFITSISGYVNTPWMGAFHSLFDPLSSTVLINAGSYAGTKRSIELVADTLRLELKPLDVNVLCVVTGAVKTAGQTYFEDLKLPSASLYKAVEETFIARAQGKGGLSQMEALDYANAVVDQIAARADGRFWCGGSAEMTRQGTTAVAVPQEALVGCTRSFLEYDAD